MSGQEELIKQIRISLETLASRYGSQGDTIGMSLVNDALLRLVAIERHEKELVEQ